MCSMYFGKIGIFRMFCVSGNLSSEFSGAVSPSCGYRILESFVTVSGTKFGTNKSKETYLLGRREESLLEQSGLVWVRKKVH